MYGIIITETEIYTSIRIMLLHNVTGFSDWNVGCHF